MFQISVLPEEIEKLELAAFAGKITVIDRPGPEMEHAIAYLRRQKIIGFDTESRPSFTPLQPHYGVALLQLSGPKEAFLFRIKQLGMDDRLCRILANEKIIKVGAAVHDDVRGLQKYKPFEAKGFIDLQKIVWEYGIRDKSVKKMSAIILGYKISKTQQLSNWEAEILSESQQLYAATDAWVCREMYNVLMKSEKNPLTPEQMMPIQGPPHKNIDTSSEQAKPAEPEAAAKEKKRRKKRPRKKKSMSAATANVNVNAARADQQQTAGKHKKRHRRYFRKKKNNGKDNTEKSREDSLKRFHPWVFSGAIAQIVGNPAEGDVVSVYSSEGDFLAAGHYQIGSIAVRVLSFETDVINDAYWEAMLSKALEVRIATGLAQDGGNTNCYRLVHGEGDNLPGLIIDWYDGVCVMQAHSAGMFRAKNRLQMPL